MWHRRIHFFALLSAACAALYAPDAEADVILEPGVLQGTLSFSGETVMSSYVFASSNDGYSAWGDFSNNTFSLTVEGDHAYSTYLSADVANPGASTSIQVARSPYTLVPIGATIP